MRDNQIYERFGPSVIRLENVSEFLIIREYCGKAIYHNRFDHYLQSNKYPIYLSVDDWNDFCWMQGRYHDEEDGMQDGVYYYLNKCNEDYKYLGGIQDVLDALCVPSMSPIQNVDMTIL